MKSRQANHAARSTSTVSGIGVHSGLPVTLTLHPADADTGIVFLRTGIDGRPRPRNPRRCARRHRDRIRHRPRRSHRGPLCSTAEHVLAALRGLGVDNAVVEIDGPEVPIMDGSADAFRRRHRPGRHRHAAGAAPLYPGAQAGPRRQGRFASANCGRYAQRLPHRDRDRFRPSADRPPVAGARRRAADSFRRELARARTFGFMRDVAKLWSAGYALGASLREYAGRHREPDAQSRRPALRRRIRAPQGARRHRRSGACRCAAARRLPFGARRPQAQPCGAVGADGRSVGLDDGRGRRQPARGARPCRCRARPGGPAYGPDVS